MSTLLIEELYPGVQFDQPIKIRRPINLAVIRPWIYKQGTLVDGELTLEVLQGVNSLATIVIDFSDINTEIPAPYAHGYIRFEFDSLQLNVEEGQAETEYILRFSMENHTLDTTNYIAISRDWDDPKMEVYGVGPSDVQDPAGIELYNYKG